MLLICLMFFALPQQGIAAVYEPEELTKDEAALLGIYAGNGEIFLIREAAGKLQMVYRYLNDDKDFTRSNFFTLDKEHYDAYTLKECGPATNAESTLTFDRDKEGRGVGIKIGDRSYTRKFTSGEDGKPLKITPKKSWEELRAAAKAAVVPNKPFTAEADLVDLASVVPNLHYDLRYTTNNNLFSYPLVTSKKAYLDKEAAQALGRVQKDLEPYGYGLIVWEAYRSWEDFKLATLALGEKDKSMLPKAEEGYPHNTGRSIDVSLYKLSNGEAVEMLSDFDEATAAQYRSFVGGSSLQRWQRDLLRQQMSREGFASSDMEWWHFDYQPEIKYKLLNVVVQ